MKEKHMIYQKITIKYSDLIKLQKKLTELTEAALHIENKFPTLPSL